MRIILCVMLSLLFLALATAEGLSSGSPVQVDLEPADLDDALQTSKLVEVWRQSKCALAITSATPALMAGVAALDA